MFRDTLRLCDRALAHLPGWLFVISGMSLFAIAVLTPAWAQTRRLNWEMELMREQSHRLVNQQNTYRDFDKALAEDDPVLVRRLAFYQLRLKPTGTDPVLTGTLPLPAPADAMTKNGVKLAANRKRTPGPTGPAAPPPVTTADQFPSIDRSLYKPVAQPGVNYPDYVPVQSRLTRITQGPGQIAMFAAGLLAVTAGLMMNPRSTRDVSDDASPLSPCNDDDAIPPTISVAPPTDDLIASSRDA